MMSPFNKYSLLLNLWLELNNLKLNRMNCTKWNARTAIWVRSSHAPVLESPASDDSCDVFCTSVSLSVGWSLPGDTMTVRWHYVTPCIGLWVFCTMKCLCLAENLYLTVYIYRFPDLCIDSLDDAASLPSLCPSSDDESDDAEEKTMHEDRITEVCGNKYQPSKDVFDLPAPACIIYDNACNLVNSVLDTYVPTRLWQCAIYLRRIHKVMCVHLYPRT